VSVKLYVEDGGNSKALRRACAKGFRTFIDKAGLVGQRATRNTQKGPYSKGAHSFEILATLDPGSIAAAAPHAKRFLDTVRKGGSA
jgi:hypothetical protein